MKKIILTSICVFLLLTSKAQIVTDTVSTGAGYSNQKWYSLQNDEQGTAQSKDNWDIAFEITGQAASIIGNTQKANFGVYKSPYTIAQWSSLDTAGINSWSKLYNSDTSWSIGAFNKGINPADQYDLGWGIYDVNTHYVNGDSCYVIKLSATSYKKIKFDNLSNGAYNFTYADLDGTNSQIGVVTKSNYTGKNFAYYDLTNNTAIDREPTASSWDLTFIKYTTFIPNPYSVTGIVSNKGVKVAQANTISNTATYSNYASHTFSTEINAVGYDWKSFNGATYIIEDSLVYFVLDKAGNIWSIIPTGFGGSATGDYIFNKKLLSSTGINDIAGKTKAILSIYPNPANEGYATIIYDFENSVSSALLTVYDLSGKKNYSEKLNNTLGLHTYNLNTSEFNSGMYFITVEFEGNKIQQKLIIHKN